VGRVRAAHWTPVGVIPKGRARGAPGGRPADREGEAARGREPEYRGGPHQEWAWCGGPPLSYFQDEYVTGAELFPIREVRFHGIRAPVPRDGWPVLRRAYGASVGHMARMDEHGGVWADLRDPEHARLRRPARVRQVGAWMGGWG
jgi:hypothetical protein